MKNQLSINVRKENEVLVVSSREVAENFSKNHKDVLESIKTLIKGVAENSADPMELYFIQTKYQHEQNKQWYKEYLLTEDGFTLLAMGFTGSKAMQWKLKYINEFKRMRETLNQMIPMLTEEQKLQLAVFSAKTKEETEVASANLDRYRQKQLAEKDEQLQIQAPKVEQHDKFLQADDSISFEELSKIFNIKGMGRNNIFKFLRELGILMTIGSRKNRPYENYKQYFQVLESVNKYNNELNYTTYVKPIGVDYIYKKLKENGYIVDENSYKKFKNKDK